MEVMNMLTGEFNLEEYKEVLFEEGEKRGLEKGEQRVLKLMKQGLSYDEIKKRLEQSSKKKHK